MRVVLVLASLGLWSATTFAEGEMQPPKPSEEIKTLAKSMVGVWKCDGKSTYKGKEKTTQGRATFTSELDGFVVAGTFDRLSEKVMARDMVGYDAATKTFRRASYDISGGTSESTSKGFEGGVMTWTGKGTQMGSAIEYTQTITQKSPTEMGLSGTQKWPGADTSSYEMTCKK